MDIFVDPEKITTQILLKKHKDRVIIIQDLKLNA